MGLGSHWQAGIARILASAPAFAGRRRATRWRRDRRAPPTAPSSPSRPALPWPPRLPYVVLHPAPATVLELTDCVFLLRPQ